MNQEVELVVLSGSTHAEKAALDMHTLIVSACTNFAVAEGIQGVFSNTCMRVYTNIDVKKRNKQQLVSDYGIRIYIKEKYFMRFSVVIPLYNKERYIQNTIESVLQQTFTDFEVIVVNDGSTDNSLSIAENIKSDKLRIISQENAGVAVARNTGINYANAEYVAFLDADDYWHSNYLEEINKLIDDFPESNIFVTSYRIIMGKKKYRSSAHLSEEPILLPSYWMTFKSAYDVVWTSVTTIRKEAILKAGLFTPGEEIGQDLDLWSRVARDNPKVAYSPEVCADYNRNAEQNARTRVKIAYPKAFLRV